MHTEVRTKLDYNNGDIYCNYLRNTTIYTYMYTYIFIFENYLYLQTYVNNSRQASIYVQRKDCRNAHQVYSSPVLIKD